MNVDIRPRNSIDMLLKSEENWATRNVTIVAVQSKLQELQSRQKTFSPWSIGDRSYSNGGGSHRMLQPGAADIRNF